MPDLYPWQEDALGRLRDGSILLGGTGSGKSMTALAYYMRHHLPKPLYIITTAKKRDEMEWHWEIGAWGLYTAGDHSRAKVVIDSWQNIKKYREVKDAFFILDEQKLIGKGVWVKSFYDIAKSNKWLLLTATPADTWMDLIPVFVASGYYKNRTEFMRAHVHEKQTKQGYPVIAGYYGERKLERLRDQVIVAMPYERKTIRERKTIFCEYHKDALKYVVEKRWNIFEDRAIKSASEFAHVYRRVLWSDWSRLTALLDIVHKHRKVIVFYTYDYELERLRSGLSETGVRYAEWNGHKHEPLPSDEFDEWVYLVNYNSGSEAWNCITSDTMVFYSQPFSYRKREQCEGRIDRLNTSFTVLHYYTLSTHTAYEGRISRTVDNKKSFNDSAWVKGLGLDFNKE